jgi:hypothetical protein
MGTDQLPLDEEARRIGHALIDWADRVRQRKAARETAPQGGSHERPPASRTPSHAPPPDDGAVVPFGRDKGTLLSAASASTLTWLATALQTSLDDPEKAKFRTKNLKDLTALRAEQARRGAR